LGLANLIWRNLPSRKPQLWDHLFRAMARRLIFESRRRLSPRWIDEPHVVRILDGSPRLAVVPRDAIGRAIFLYGVYEIATTKFVTAALQPGDCFVDVGAHVGYYSVLAGTRVGPAGEVHAFEPVSRLRCQLQRNIEMNGLHNVIAHGTAVWSEEGEIAFYETLSADNSGISSVFPGPARTGMPCKVGATTLDELARRIRRRIDLIKIDVEGGELAVFEGGPRLLDSAEAPVLIFEAFEIGPPARLLERHGYEVRCLHYSRAKGIQLPGIDGERESPFSSYEAPNFVAFKPGWLSARGLDTTSILEE
jgi:FkbM family methyltransferase